ncbi:hypothetical protein [Synechococcus sp. CS-1328]|uniref:hypothetical protein n=1 Tax=Synechococcus sp. CS-1328 TaxID=2847976 RepID=UPI00223AF9DD|nr:hypothetical protein [Synechococcus sp. CS-1328]MCT0225691.1 hypothetical protein [Synechococcus sp. CS-1328]
MALRRHRLPRVWLAITLGLVATAVGVARWWEGELPQRLADASQRGELDACLRYSEQLSALQWMAGRAPLEQGQCRRLKARQLWEQQNWPEALALQLQLVNSAAGGPADRKELQTWQEQLRRRALTLFRDGDLEGALTVLAAMGEERRENGTALGDSLREQWNRNRLQLERARQLAERQRWWEALDALNRIDHPWWKQESNAVREEVDAGVKSLSGADQEHDSHGDLPHTVPTDKLDALVQKRIAAGVDEWSAFEQACQELGGKIVEAGPESACQR